MIRRLLEPETTHDDLLDIMLELLVDIRADAEALDTLHGHGRSHPVRVSRGAVIEAGAV